MPSNERIPEAYRTGYQDFYGREFKVTPDVLIPRPETEQIIDQVLILAGKPYLPGVKPTERELSKNPLILDVGTGSGCIAITIKKELEKASVYASDISKEALNIANENAKNHQADITFVESDLLKDIKITPEVLIANLPYVDPEWDWLDQVSLSHEPNLALYADDHGLKLIKELIIEASSRKIKYLILESDPCQHEEIEAFAGSHDYILYEERGFIQTFKYN
ncbi:peptide chain release factor N(5)-glutamine methyltransferase [Candidatus Saccharibacteria bacterium]|nr:peptide chain release factor N(5)-glutamine methyltransferase [Candidatus Saccharibacteria bacterium]